MLVVLAACGTAVDEGSAIGESVSAIRGQRADFVPRFITLLKEDAPALQVGFIDTDAAGTLLLESQDDDFAYWLSPEGTQIILQSGLLHGVRGYGEGLLASELSEPIARVRGLEPGWSDRFHTYLDGNDFAVTRTYRCLIEDRGAREIDLFGTPTATRLLRESCRSLNQDFVNLYWVRPSSRDIVVSRQWAGPVIGAISTRIVPR